MIAPQFEIRPFIDKQFFDAFGNQTLYPVEQQERARYIYRYLKEKKAATFVIEREYIDGDYLDDFSAYYVKCFFAYERRCTRLHFFKESLNQDQFTAFLRDTLAEDRKNAILNSYLGFLVVRPLPDALIGRTVLQTYDSDGGRRHYPCTRLYTSNLFGTDLCIKSLAFQEQDSVLAACATVALWCCFQKTSELFPGTPSPTPATITRSATSVSGRTRAIPSHGLNIYQMCTAIRQTGLEPEVLQVNRDVPLISMIYAYASTGFPVILGVAIENGGLHAVTVTGFSLRRSRVLKREEAGNPKYVKYIPMIGLRIDELYVHDDQIGPFTRLQVNESAKLNDVVYPVVFSGSWQDKSGKGLRLCPVFVAVPVYHKIRVTFIDVQALLTGFTSLVEYLYPGFSLEWEIQLWFSNELKKDIKKAKLSMDQMDQVLMKAHPRFIWRASITIHGLKTLEFLADATDMARSFPIYHVIWHRNELKETLRALLRNKRLEMALGQLLVAPFVSLLKKACS